MFFEIYLLNSYNLAFRDKLVKNCPCYRQYATRQAFCEEIIAKRRSYMACLGYDSNTRKRIRHRSVPIVLGSFIDYEIRGAAAMLECRSQWGLIVLNGILKIYLSFSTFDALSMHVRETRLKKSIDWFTYVNDEGLAISYNKKVVTWTYKHKTCDSTQSNEWISLIAQSNPFGVTNILADEYICMFDTILRYPYSMNDLKNRQFLNGPTIMLKYINHDLNRRKKKKTAGCLKMSTAFEIGALFQALSKKNTFETEEWCKTYPQNYDNTMHEGRSNKTAHFLPNVTRASNDAVRNSKALTFPDDAVYYFCPLNTKDLKSAGEQHVLCDFVMMTEETDQMMLYHYLNTIAQPHGSLIFTINGYLINCRRASWTLDDLIALKRQLPHVTTIYHLPYVRISSKSSIPIKYSQQHDCFFSTAETMHFGIEYPECDMLSITAKELSIHNLRKTPPAKITVSLNNMKGSVAMVTSDMHRLFMENSLGVTCYMNVTREQIARLIDHAVISHGHDTADFERWYAKLSRALRLDEQKRASAATAPPCATSPQKAVQALYRIYDPKDLKYECRKINSKPFVCCNNESNVPAIQEYASILYSGKNYQSASIWNLRLRAAFGNPFGSCIEDGVVIDSAILPHIAPIYYNACITVVFTFKTAKQPNDAKFITINERNGIIPNETLICCLISEHEVYVKNSKHSSILTTKIGQHYYYLVRFLSKKTAMYDKLRVRHIQNHNSITVVITGQNVAYVDVGSKVANAFGQKNIISCKTDALRDKCWGITRDGRKVHAQLVYSEVSLIGRIPSGQLYEMFTSDELAIGPNGEFIAPVDLIIHTLHPYTNIKIFDVKVDTLTNINGFDSQNLSNASTYLRTEQVHDKVIQLLGLHGYNVEFADVHEPPRIVVEPTHRLYSRSLHLEGAAADARAADLQEALRLRPRAQVTPMDTS